MLSCVLSLAILVVAKSSRFSVAEVQQFYMPGSLNTMHPHWVLRDPRLEHLKGRRSSAFLHRTSVETVLRQERVIVTQVEAGVRKLLFCIVQLTFVTSAGDKV